MKRTSYQGVVQPRGFPGLPEGWISEWETFQSSDGNLQLFGVLHHLEPWEPSPLAHRLLLVLHGLGEHGGRYLHVPHFVRSAVGAVYCLDHRGHGRSEGLRGHIERFDLFADDVAYTVKRLEEQLLKRFGKAEIHLLAHSLGGHVALRTLFLHPDLPLHSATVTSPFLGIKAKVPAVKKFAGLALARVWGSLQLSTGLDAALVSRDPEVVHAYRTDRLVHDKMTPRFFVLNQAAMDDTLSRDSGIRVPLQMIVSMGDGIVDEQKSLRFFKNLQHRDKQLKAVPDLYHEPLNEPEKDRVFADVTAWIESHSHSRSG